MIENTRKKEIEKLHKKWERAYKDLENCEINRSYFGDCFITNVEIMVKYLQKFGSDIRITKSVSSLSEYTVECEELKLITFCSEREVVEYFNYTAEKKGELE